MILVKEKLWQLAHVFAILEFSGSDLASLSEIAVLVEHFVHFVFNSGFEIEVFQKAWNHVLNFLRLHILRLYDLILNIFLDIPECV